MYTCTSVENALSTCTAITCGDGADDDDEECDDGNFDDDDGCSSACIEEQGYSCSGTTCTDMCGDETIYQQSKTDSSDTSYVYYTEVCDGVSGCTNSTCTAELGYTCTVDSSDWSSSCTQTCGNSVHNTDEVCDDGNNVSGDGCAEGCLEVESGYICALVGSCSTTCGDGVYDGTDASIG